MSQTWTIVSHRNFHHDEAWAILLLRKYGSKLYPGIESAAVEYVDDPQSVNGLELVSRGKICIGCGGALYDEHGRERETCCAELVAKHLGLLENKAIANILNYVRNCDRTADVRPQELPSLIKQWHKQHPNDAQLVLDRTLGILEDWLNANLSFQKTFTETKPDKKFFPLLGLPQGAPKRNLCYAVFNTNNSEVPVVARIKGVDIVIIKKPRGNVQIFTRSTKDAAGVSTPVADISDAVRIIRQAEMRKRGQDHKALSDEYLRGPEKLPEVPCWYYLEAGQMLLNGSDQAGAAVEPTKVSVDDIVQAIKVGARPLTKVPPEGQMAEAIHKAETVTASK
jgi:hypothetical protein